MRPLAVIIPAYKARFLSETLESLASQADRSFSCYVFDDASPEALAPIVDRFRERLPIHYHRFEQNVGGHDLAQQWKRCVQETNEPWIWLIPDDDYLEPGCMAAALTAITRARDTQVLLRFSITTISSTGGIIHVRRANPSTDSARGLMKDSLIGLRPFSLGENIFRRTAYTAVGGHESFGGGSGSDLSLLLKLAHYGEFVNLPGPRFRFRHHAASISSGATKYQKSAVAGVLECCLWLHNWNRQTHVAAPWLLRYWTLRWFHACLKNWAPLLDTNERNTLAAFAREEWKLPRFIHDKLLAGRRR